MVCYQKDVDKAYSVTFCLKCYQEALEIDNGGKCIFCHYEVEADDIAGEFIKSYLGVNEYETVTDGGEYPKYFCPDCGSDTFVYVLKNRDKAWVCFTCGTKYGSDEIAYCETCGDVYIRKMDDLRMCANCISYRLGD